MAFEQTWRWFGPNDPISLREIKQTGATGIVNALHQIPVGEVWTVEEITRRKDIIESEGLNWSVVESLPVHEDIKKRKGKYKEYIDNYKVSLRNLGKCGVDTVCYNFMPVLDWSRTDLNVTYRDGSVTSKFELKSLAAFDLFILKRPGADNDYNPQLISKAEEYFRSLDEKDRVRLKETILYGLPGSMEAYSMEEFGQALKEYYDIGDKQLRENLYSFLRDVVPAAEESGVFMAIHPDDPPIPLLGLPRVVSSRNDLIKITEAVDSASNGITFCTGSLGAGPGNNLTEMAEELSGRINFIHLRNVVKNEDGDFYEENHLEGDVDIFSIMKILLLEQKKRLEEGRKDARMPLRPDHGHLMLPDSGRKNIYPGYSLMGRMRGLAELRGMELGIRRAYNI